MVLGKTDLKELKPKMKKTKIKKEPPEADEDNVETDEPPDAIFKRWCESRKKMLTPGLEQFLWLQWNQQTGSFFCQPCDQMRHLGTFSGTEAIEVFLEHEGCDFHIECMSMMTGTYERGSDAFPASFAPMKDHCESARSKKRKNSSTNYEMTRKRRFCPHWLTQFPWLEYNTQKCLMFCKFCLKHGKNGAANTLVKGSNTFRVMSLQIHAGSKDHQHAEKLERLTVIDRETTATGKHYLHKKEEFFVRKYLNLYPWLSLRSGDMVVCELCQQHGFGSSTLVVMGNELNYQLVKIHRETKHHVMAERMEVLNWNNAWDRESEEIDDTLAEASTVSTGLTACDVDGRFQYTATSPIKNDNMEEGEILVNSDLSKDKESVNLSTNLGSKSWYFHTDETLNSQFVSDSQQIPNSTTEVPIEPKLFSTRVHPAFEAFGYELSPSKQFEPILNESNSNNNRLDNSNELVSPYGSFKKEWLVEFPWLDYDEKQGLMKCKLCSKHGKKNSFSKGVNIFWRKHITNHVTIKKHQDAVNQETWGKKQSSVGVVPLERPCLQKCDSMESGSSSDAGIGSSPCSEASDLFDDMTSDTPVSDNQKAVSIGSRKLVIKMDAFPTDILNYKHDERSPESLSSISIVDSVSPTCVNGIQSHLNDELLTSPKPSPKKRVRRFCQKWLDTFSWLEYKETENAMYCMWCVNAGFKNSFTSGNSHFHIDFLRCHMTSKAHQETTKPI